MRSFTEELVWASLDHDSASKQEAIEWHGLNTLALDCPITRQVRPDVFCSTEPGTRDERDVRMLSDRPIRRENGLVEVLI